MQATMRAIHTATRLRSTSCRRRMSGSRRRTGTARRCRPTRRRRTIALTQGNGTSGTGWNYYNNGYATNPYGPWNVGSGSQELNGTYDMMGNDWEWMESPYSSGDYGTGSSRGLRGGCWLDELRAGLASSAPRYQRPDERERQHRVPRGKCS